MKVIKKFDQFINESHRDEIREFLGKESFKYKLDAITADTYYTDIDMIVDIKITGVDSSVEDRANVFLGFVDTYIENEIEDKIGYNGNYSLSFDLDIYHDGVIVHNDGEGDNNFASKEDFQKFINILRKFYLSEDKGAIATMIGRLSDTDLKDHNIQGGEFFVFVKTNFDNFDKFETTLKKHNRV